MTHNPRLFSRPFVLTCLANLMAGLSAMMFIQLPRLFKQLGASEANIGLIYSVAALAGWRPARWSASCSIVAAAD